MPPSFVSAGTGGDVPSGNIALHRFQLIRLSSEEQSTQLRHAAPWLTATTVGGVQCFDYCQLYLYTLYVARFAVDCDAMLRFARVSAVEQGIGSNG